MDNQNQEITQWNGHDDDLYIVNNEFALVYNACHGGFDISNEAIKFINEITNKHYYNHESELENNIGGLKPIYCDYIKRTYPPLIMAIEKYQEKVNGDCAKLKIIWIDIKYKNCWKINEYDGKESIVISPEKELVVLLREKTIEEFESMTYLDLKEFVMNLKNISSDNKINMLQY